MDSIFLDLPQRDAKPRTSGLTMAIDNGIPQRAFADAILSAAEYIDVVKAVSTPGRSSSRLRPRTCRPTSSSFWVPT